MSKREKPAVMMMLDLAPAQHRKLEKGQTITIHSHHHKEGGKPYYIKHAKHKKILASFKKNKGIRLSGGDLLGDIGNFFGSVGNKVKDTFNSVGQQIKSGFDAFGNKITGTAEEIANKVKQQANNLISQVKSKATTDINQVKSVLNNPAVDGLTKLALLASGTQAGLLNSQQTQDAFKLIKSGATNIGDAITSTAKDVGNTIKSTATDVGNTIVSTATDLGNNLKSDLGTAVNWIKDLPAEIQKFFIDNSPLLKQIAITIAKICVKKGIPMVAKQLGGVLADALATGAMAPELIPIAHALGEELGGQLGNFLADYLMSLGLADQQGLPQVDSFLNKQSDITNAIDNATSTKNIISGIGIGMPHHRRSRSRSPSEEREHKLMVKDHHADEKILHAIEFAKRLLEHHEKHGGFLGLPNLGIMDTFNEVKSGNTNALLSRADRVAQYDPVYGLAKTAYNNRGDIGATIRDVGHAVKQYVPRELVKAGLTTAATAGASFLGMPQLGVMAAPFISKAVDFGYDYTPNQPIGHHLQKFAQDPMLEHYASQYAPEAYGHYQSARSAYDQYAPMVHQAHHAYSNPQQFAQNYIQQQPQYQEAMSQYGSARNLYNQYQQDFQQATAPPLYNYSNPYQFFGSGLKGSHKKSRVGKDKKHRVGKGASAYTSLPYHEVMTQSKVVSGGALKKKVMENDPYGGSGGSGRPIVPEPSAPMDATIQLGSPYARINSPAMSPFIPTHNQLQGYAPLNKHNKIGGSFAPSGTGLTHHRHHHKHGGSPYPAGTY